MFTTGLFRLFQPGLVGRSLPEHYREKAMLWRFHAISGVLEERADEKESLLESNDISMEII